MRAAFVTVHRWAGLITAAFLFFSGVTGAVISWDHALDEWLNSHLFEAKAQGTASIVDLAKLIERATRAPVVSYLSSRPKRGTRSHFSC